MTDSSILTVISSSGVEIIRIARDGRVLWRGAEVTTDADFRSAMLDLAARLGGTSAAFDEVNDARRYRYLRAHPQFNRDRGRLEWYLPHWAFPRDMSTAERLDASIDSAIALSEGL